jgi:hydrogenase maturation protease
MRKVVIGLGHPYRRDDAAGLEVARRVRHVEAHLRMIGDYELIDLWEGADEVIVVDATRSYAPAGTVKRFNPAASPLPRRTFASSHSVGLAETIELARELGHLPATITVYGIEAGDVRQGEGLTEPVADAVDRVVEEIQGSEETGIA